MSSMLLAPDTDATCADADNDADGDGGPPPTAGCLGPPPVVFSPNVESNAAARDAAEACAAAARA